jgi:hypothetical protein
LLALKRTEFTGSGPFAAFARKVAGIEVARDLATEYTRVADYAKAQDAAREESLAASLVRGSGRAASVPIPTFVSFRRTLCTNVGIEKDTSHFIDSSAAFRI